MINDDIKDGNNKMVPKVTYILFEKEDAFND